MNALRPILRPLPAALVVLASLAAVFGAIEAALRWVLAGTPAPSLHLAVFFVGLDVGLGLVVLAAARLRLKAELPRQGDREPSPPLSILVAAFDEAPAIVETVESIAAQREVDFEILVRFLEVGGFPEDSLTEDYELTFRLVRRGVETGRAPVVVCVPSAQVFTDGPSDTLGFVRQRTRWFAGFLSTLFRFRALIANPRAAAFGLVRLPLKVVDAFLPLVAFATLFVLGDAGFGVVIPTSRAALLLFTIRWVWDLVFFAMARRLGAHLGPRTAEERADGERRAPSPLLAWLCTATEALTYVWFKHASTLRAYVWSVRKVRTWERSRARQALTAPLVT